MKLFRSLVAVAVFALPVAAQYADRYALFISDSQLSPRAAHASLTATLTERHIPVTGETTQLLNAVFVSATPEEAAALKTVAGVKGVVRLRKYRRTLSTALPLMGVDGAWTTVGGGSTAGKGIKIGILDSGVDQNHPSLQDATLQTPAGFPKCEVASNCANFTNSKVIVARSYVRLLGADDYSARDRSGHGTAVATAAAGNTSTAGTVAITGVAPKAWIGSYKIFGSPEVNDYTTDDVVVAALEDAIADGMDVISLSVGGPAFTGPLDTGAACGNPADVPCDIAAAALEAAAQRGAVIVVSAGNAGANGVRYPTLGSVNSPATAPSVIAVGAATNSHEFTPVVRLPGVAVIPAYLTDAESFWGARGAVLRDVAGLDGGGYGCSALPAGSLANSFALIQRGPSGTGSCTFAVKMRNAVNAGAVGTIFFDYPGSTDFPLTASGLGSFGLPAFLISNASGQSVKAYLATHPSQTAVLDPAGSEVSGVTPNQLAFYSSMGPATGTNAIKPELVATGGGGQKGDLLFMGSQSWDPLGDLYSATGFVAAAGTSFATPLIAGAAALVKQAHPTYTGAQIRSALINTTTGDVVSDDSDDAVGVTQVGNGRLAANLAVRSTVTVSPATISFGTASGSNTLQVTNTGIAATNLTLSSTGNVTLGKTALTLAAGATGSVDVTISGAGPGAGIYSGAITIGGGAVDVRVPWMYGVGSPAVANFAPLAGDGNVVGTGRPLPDGVLVFQLTDANGIAIPEVAVNFVVNRDSVPVNLANAAARTDAYGIARVEVTAGTQPGTYSIEGCAGTCSATNQFEYAFTGRVRALPTVLAGGVIPATGTAAAIAPGSYFSIYGTALADGTKVTSTVRLPIAMQNVNVRFEVAAAGIRLLAPIVFVSEGQINAQVPWELTGQTTAQMTVVADGVAGAPVTVSLANTVPAFFQNPIGSGLVAAVDPLNAGNPILTQANPAKRGSVIALYANGLGAVSDGPESGEPASTATLARTTTTPVVTIGGQAALVWYSGLTPGLPGLYQINVTVPAGIAAGNQTVTLQMNGVAAKPVTIPLQ